MLMNGVTSLSSRWPSFEYSAATCRTYMFPWKWRENNITYNRSFFPAVYFTTMLAPASNGRTNMNWKRFGMNQRLWPNWQTVPTKVENKQSPVTQRHTNVCSRSSKGFILMKQQWTLFHDKAVVTFHTENFHHRDYWNALNIQNLQLTQTVYEPQISEILVVMLM